MTDIGAAIGGAMQIRHVAGVSAIQPFAVETQLGVIRRRCDAARIETELARLGFDI
jgi:hypothetical protein